MSILNFNEELNVEEFDNKVKDALNPNSNTKRDSEIELVQFKEDPNAYLRIGLILERSKQKESHFFVLQILEEMIKTKWVVFTEEQKNSLKCYIVGEIINRAKDVTSDKFVLKKLNLVLIAILKKDWPHRWPTFINDLITSSQSVSMDVCANSLIILKLFSDDIFIYNSNLTIVRKKSLQERFKIEFSQILQLIISIFEYSRTMNVCDTLIEATFSALKSFIPFVPESYLTQSNIIDYILFYNNSQFSLSVLACLTELFKTEFDDKVRILRIHQEVIDLLRKYFSKFTLSDIKIQYEHINDSEKRFILQITFFLARLYSKKIKFLESEDLVRLKEGLEYLATISMIDDSRIFTEVLEIWYNFVYTLYEEYPYKDNNKILFRQNFSDILKTLAKILTEKMVRPQEVFIVENEFGEIVKEKMVETEQIEFYKKMKKTIFYVAFLQPDFIKNFFLTTLHKQVNENEFTWNNINRICWSIGAISGSFSEEEDSSFFVDVLKDLLALCEFKQLKKDKAVVASNIMYIIGQYHRFLLTNKKFFQTVIKKLYEFMDEKHEGIQDMACDTFLTIAKKCPGEFFVKDFNYPAQEYIYSVLNQTPNLEFYQKRILIEAITMIIQTKENNLNYTNALLNKIHNNFRLINTNDLMQNSKEISNIFKSYTIIYSTIKDSIKNNIFSDTLVLYNTLNEYNNGNTDNTSLILKKNSLLIKSDITEMFCSVIRNTKLTTAYNRNINTSNLLNNYKNPNNNTFNSSEGINLLENVLDLEKLITIIVYDYKNYQDSKILDLLSELIENNYYTNDIFVKDIIEVSIPMIIGSRNTDLTISYFNLLKAITVKRFTTFYNLLINYNTVLDGMVNSLLFGLGCKKDISESAFAAMKILIKNSYDYKNIFFYKKYYFTILENIFDLLLDKDKNYSLEEQCNILHFLIKIIYDTSIQLNDNKNNMEIFKEFVYAYFKEMNLSPEYVELTFNGLLNLDENNLKDFMNDIRIKTTEYTNNDEIEEERLLLEERIRMNKN
ncbi:Exportin [Spraguea lophii 42_110]|uniref:Exportin n=1 Tax=Spraguea lophii (strain 42_110) TaxID=1358809 RepID=S7XUT6_SPRLO|nr:Exportin [Spraguea lophii 42_110]